MNFKYLFPFFFSLFFLAITTAQTSYYCDPINGNNSNNGSITSPLSSFGSVNWSSIGLQDQDVIYLLNGQHGTGFIQNFQFATKLTIKAVNAHQAVLTNITINNCSKVFFEDLKFDASLGSFSLNDPIVLGNDASDFITLNNCLIQSADDSSTWTKTDWYNNAASGVQFRGTNITLTNNTFLNLYHAVELRGDYSYMQNNSIVNFAADAIRGLGSYSTYENNLIKNCFIDDYAIQHDDAFQAFKSPGSSIISNVSFRNNKIILFENPSQFVIDNDLIGALMQGIIITDGNAEGWLVENNLVVSGQSHGITLYGAQNCRIQNNTVVQTPILSNLTDVPWISIQDQGKSGGRQNKNNTLRNNIAGRFTTWTYGANTSDEHNIDIDQSSIANYDAYFIDYTNGDFHSIAPSPAVNAGINTDLLATDLDGNNRIYNNGIVDAGCYEFQGNGSVAPKGNYEITSSGDGNIANAATVTSNNPFLTGINTGSPAELSLFIGGRDVNHDSNTSSAILPFKLPKRPSGEKVIQANLQVNLHYIKEWIHANIDLYGLPYQPNNTIYASNHYDDVYTTSHGTDTAIQDDFISRLNSEILGNTYTPNRKVETNTTGSSALLNYINEQYDAGASEGDYIFLRLNIDAPINTGAPTSLPTAASHYYAISDETTGENAPKLTLSIGNPLSLETHITTKNNLLIFPNPVKNGLIGIKSELLSSMSKLEIQTLTGQIVYLKNIEATPTKETQVFVKLQAGAYILKLSNYTASQTHKLILK
ncbi:right-handed parallel beta-helix repeat-containing protein [Flavicella sediminum]|uniref:right-handed parallel beta-helix repeat-containing protein n=1 Tax=Flavicella sediminum TaxID=2585141 RepID=UPI0011206672|nr:right-handed parallel beta-helix repeat-containing protein [Flavicella sediminum]